MDTSKIPMSAETNTIVQDVLDSVEARTGKRPGQVYNKLWSMVNAILNGEAVDGPGYVLMDVRRERNRQDKKWGPQNYEDFSSRQFDARTVVPGATWIKNLVALCAEAGDLTWAAVLLEEVAEAFEAKDDRDLRAELVQVAAVAVAWIEAIDGRRST